MHTARRGWGPRCVLSMALEYMGMVLACPSLALDSQIFQAWPSSFGAGAPKTQLCALSIAFEYMRMVLDCPELDWPWRHEHWQHTYVESACKLGNAKQ